MGQVLVDTNIFAAIFRGDAVLQQTIETLDPAVCTIIYLELIQGQISKSDVKKIETYLATFDFVPFAPNISDRAVDLIRRYSNSHGLLLADAIIAATCLEEKLDPVTFNKQDVRFISGVCLVAV